jgi:hypothetical protein
MISRRSRSSGQRRRNIWSALSSTGGGEVKPDSEQLAGWQSRNDSYIYHHRVRQTWTVRAGDRLLIEKLVVTGADTPSPISA